MEQSAVRLLIPGASAHTDDDVARTVAAFETTFGMLAAEGAL